MGSASLAHEYDRELGAYSKGNRKVNTQTQTIFRWFCFFTVGMVYFAVLFYFLLLDVAKCSEYNVANPLIERRVIAWQSE